MLGQIALDRGEASQALEWFRSAARSGDAAAFNMLGRCHERGWGTEPDSSAAARYYLKAADLGDVWAMFNLADLHCRGDGVARDDEAAHALYLAAARRGHVKSLNMLGLFHEAGRSVPPDRAAALAFFRAAAEGGDCWGRFNLARLLLADGFMAEALGWFERALDSGFPDFHRAMGEALADEADARLLALSRSAFALASGEATA